MSFAGFLRRRTGLLVLILLVIGVSALALAWRRLAPSPLKAGVEAYERRDWSKAAGLAAVRLQAAPNDREALRLLARATFRLGRDEQARGLYRTLDPRVFQAEDYYLLGLAMRSAGDLPVALSCWEAGRDADPGRTDILESLAQVCLKLSRFHEALGVAEALAKHSGWEGRADLIAAAARLGLGEPAAAAVGFERALTREPALPDAPGPADDYRKQLARTLLQQAQPGSARNALRAVLAHGADPEAQWLLSRVAIQERAWTEAAEALMIGRAYRESHPLEPEPAPYIGAARCGDCHREIHDAQQSSRHAQTFWYAGDLPGRWLPDGEVPDPKNPRVTHRIVREGGTLRFETREGKNVADAQVEFAFGSGDRGLTLLARDREGRARECRLSRYAERQAWDVTTGQPPEPAPGEGYLGRVLSPDLAFLCLDCHTTLPRAARERSGPEAADHGIGCERCHGPGGNHVRAVEAEFSDLAIARPRAVPGGRSLQLCQQCHRSPAGKTARTDPKAVRFAATSLVWSACYTMTGGALDCITCHDPHHNADHTPAHYERKCISCHASSNRTGGDDVSARRTPVCPVNARDGCIGCHMPAVSGQIPHSTFTDHFIRVRR